MDIELLVTAMLAEAERSGVKNSLRDQIAANRSSLMRSVEVPVALMGALVEHSSDEWPPAAHVLELLIDDARMDVENEGAFGEGFLKMLENAISGMLDEGQLTSVAATSLIRCYGHADVQVPARLVSFHLAQIEAAVDTSHTLSIDFDEIIGRLAEEAEGNFYVLHEGLREVTAGLPAEMRSALVYELSSRDQPFSWSMATYSLLNRSAPIREAAALALLHRAKQGKCDGAVVRRLPMLRSWMPADPARAIVDELIRDVRRRALTASASGPAAKVRLARATLPDGAGGQSFAIVTRRKLGLILTKTGHGVKDAYVIECRSDREIQEVLDQMRSIQALDVTIETVALALSAALADGLAHDLPPAHGLVDVVGLCGLGAVRPQTMAPADWLQALDPDGQAGALSPQRRRAFINRSRQWCDDYPITDTWFEDNPEIRELLHSTASAKRQERLVWSYLESRREFWAIRVFQAALVVKGAGEDWMSLAATGSALLAGHSIGKTPVMRQIAERTLDAFDHVEGGPAELEMEFSEPASADDVSRLLAAVGMAETAPAWLDGYLTAIVIAPKMPVPDSWMGSLLEGMSGPVSEEAVQSLLLAVINRYNEFEVELAEKAEMPGFSNLTDESLRAWARGFKLGVTMVPGSWKSRCLKKDDGNIVDLIGQIAAGKDLRFDPRAIIGSWIIARFSKRR
jgi:yecA family protein